MMINEEAPLLAYQYRALWLEDAHTLSQVAECLAEATGWQPTDAQILPDALELAETARLRIERLEACAAAHAPRLKGRVERIYA